MRESKKRKRVRGVERGKMGRGERMEGRGVSWRRELGSEKKCSVGVL
jgi:hypothetical protein